MKKIVRHFLDNFRRHWYDIQAERLSDPEMQAVKEKQIAYLKQEHPDEFKRELNYVERNREWIASENLVDRLEDEHRNRMNEVEEVLDERGIGYQSRDYPEKFDTVWDELHGNDCGPTKGEPGFEPGD